MKTCDDGFPDRVKKCVSDIYESLPKDHSMRQMDYRSHEYWRLVYRCLRVLISCNMVERERVGVKYKYRWVANAPTTGSINWMVDTLRRIKKTDNDEYREIKLAKEA